MEQWFEQVLLHSYRDQLSLEVISWQHGFTLDSIPLNFSDFELFEWPVLPEGAARLPRDFDDLRYLELHPDVAAVGMNPRYHFVRHGRAEGRAYK